MQRVVFFVRLGKRHRRRTIPSSEYRISGTDISARYVYKELSLNVDDRQVRAVSTWNIVISDDVGLEVDHPLAEEIIEDQDESDMFNEWKSPGGLTKPGHRIPRVGND